MFGKSQDKARNYLYTIMKASKLCCANKQILHVCCPDLGPFFTNVGIGISMIGAG
jgi:hypothetical protein